MDKEQQLILDILKSEHFEQDFNVENFKNINQVNFYKWLVIHRLNGYVATNMLKIAEMQQERFFLLKMLKSDLNKIQSKVNTVANEIMPDICNILNEKNIPFVFLKGAITSLSVFDQIGERNYSDIDMLVAKKDLKKVKTALKENGYHQDLKNDPKGVKSTYFEMVTHQAYPFALGDRVKGEPNFELDINFAFGSEQLLKNNQMIQDVLDRRKDFEYKGMNFPTLSNEDMVIFLCIHIWRDAVYVHKIKDNEDIKLYQYLELNKVISNFNVDLEKMNEIIITYHLEKIIYFVLYHLIKLFPKQKEIVEKLMNKIQPDDTSFVDMFGIENGAGWKWPIPFEERLFNPNKFEVITNTYSLENFADFLKRESIFES